MPTENLTSEIIYKPEYYDKMVQKLEKTPKRKKKIKSLV